MKQIFKTVAVLALVAVSASCAKERIAAPSGEEAVVSFTVASPVIQTRTIADGNTVDKVACCVYNSDGKLIEDETITKTIPMTGGKAKFAVRLVTGQTYSFIFWAYKSNAEGGSDYYTLDSKNKTVKVSYDKAVSNDESRDTFCAYVEPFQITGSYSDEVKLYRPFAQLNFGVEQADIKAAKAAGITVNKSKVTLTNIGDELDLVKGEVKGEVNATFDFAACPTDMTDPASLKGETLTVKGIETPYGYVAMNYVLVGKETKNLTNATLTLAKDEAEINTLTVNNVPLQGNYRTNVVGNLFTSEVIQNIVVVPAFDGEDNKYIIDGQDELDAIIANIPEGEAAEITLSEGTYKLPALSAGTTITGTGETVIDCTGETSAGYQSSFEVSAADVTISNVTVSGNKSYTDGASLALTGKNSTVDGCTFINGRTNGWGSDLSIGNGAGSVVTVSGCDFRQSGFRGILIWESGDEVKIDNCLFDNTYPFNSQGGTGKITVTNSELKGWTSYTNTHELVSFTDCKFGKSTSGYAYLVPYCKTVVKNCTFSSDFTVYPCGSSPFTIEFIGCKYEDDKAITPDIMKSGGNGNVTYIIDGESYSF